MSDSKLFEKPFSQPCENNKDPILDHLKNYFSRSKRVLEIGSGTGQHAVHFAANLPHLNWHCADQHEYHQGINAWISEYPSDNLHAPVALSFPDDNIPDIAFDAVYTANTAHIMLEHQVANMMQQVASALPKGGVFCQYGPFIVDGKFSSKSNADFHQKLIESGYGGYRDVDELRQWAPAFNLSHIHKMPANNLLLVWRK